MANNSKKPKNNKGYIDKYKELKASGLILWSVGGKRTDKGLKAYHKTRINKAYKELKQLGGKTGQYYPPRHKDETLLGYKRRINKIKRNSGIAQTELSPILIQSELADRLTIKDNRISIYVDDNEKTAEKEFIPIDRIKFNIDPEQYLKDLFVNQIQNREFSPIDTIVPIHSHWTGDGTYLEYIENHEDFINKIVGWAYRYQPTKGLTGKDLKEANAKYDNFITGLVIETYRKK